MKQVGPLAGVKVIEMGQLIAGPFCGKILAEFGAEVIKIEPPATADNAGGDPLRTWRQLHNGTSLWWSLQARNKISVAVNLRVAEGQEIIRKLAKDADILIENFRPGALEKIFDKVNRDFTREYQLNGSPEDRRRARLERTLKRIRDWTGPLTPTQEERIAAMNETIPYTDHLRHQDRQRRQKDFLALLNTRSNKAEFARALRPWLADWEASRPPELHAALNEANDKRTALYLDIERSLTPQQRAHLQQKLQSYIDDLNALAAQRVAVK